MKTKEKIKNVEARIKDLNEKIKVADFEINELQKYRWALSEINTKLTMRQFKLMRVDFLKTIRSV
tara:strand:- start:131 stop:325 length:195 start_codon:yes stop_codon:yes gene_type:complete